MNINLITGSTGFLGKKLIYKLLEKKEKIWVIVRSIENKTSEERIKKEFPKYFNYIKVIDGDILFEGLKINNNIVEDLKNKNIIIWHLAANLSFATKDKELVWKTNFNGTRNVVNFANNVKAIKFIYVSTAYVSGNYEGEILEDEIIEGQKFNNNYEASKYEAEKYVRNNFNNIYLIFRPSIILGEVYSGKAEGCTFGYYRFTYMFFLFKLWIIKKLKGKIGFWKIILKILGTKYNKKENKIIVPWLLMLYVKGGEADLVSVDYVVDSMIKVNNLQKNKKEIIHLTNYNPAKSKFLMKLIFENLGYERVKNKEISRWSFLTILKLFYFLTFPIKKYTKSVYWYIPYVIRKYNFSHKNSEKYNLKKNISLNTTYMNKVNEYAKNNIFDKIDNPKL